MNKILVIDDDYAIRLLYENELSEEGYLVITSDNCGAIMGTIAKRMPDLIILDIEKGKFNGLDLLIDIRNAYYNMPVILCSEKVDFKHDLRSIAADYCVVKKPDLSELKSKIKMAMEGMITVIGPLKEQAESQPQKGYDEREFRSKRIQWSL